MSYTIASAIEIDKKLRDDFRRRLKDYGISAELTDPILATLFRTFAQQLSVLYGETDRIRLALLDELISNLGFEPRMARPAQTVIRVQVDQGSLLMAGGTELVGNAQSGERLTFAIDTPFVASSARLACAIAYQDGALQLLPSNELSDGLQAARPSFDPAKVNLGPNPALFIAVENLPPGHLGQHALFFELGPDAHRLQRAMLTDSWCLVGAAGDLTGAGILRPAAVTAGINALAWLLPDAEGGAPAGDDVSSPELPTGFYGPRTFVFPPVPAARRFICRMPRAMDVPFSRIFGRDPSQVFAVERAWVRISLPREIPPLRTAVARIVLHAMTASNVECFNQTIVFEKQGHSIPIVREAGGAANHLVAPLSITGESGGAYRPEMEPSADAAAGRYAVRNGRIELRAGLRADGRPDAYANVRLWVTTGILGNSVGPGGVTGFLKQSPGPGLQVFNPTAAAGGTDREAQDSARVRFGEALLSRGRVVTRNDLIAVVQAFDSRIRGVDAASGVARTTAGLRRVERLTLTLDPDDFVEYATEVEMLKDALRRHLAARTPADTQLTIDVVQP